MLEEMFVHEVEMEFGEDVIRRLLDDVRPGWETDLRTVRDRHACLVANTAEPSRNHPHG